MVMKYKLYFKKSGDLTKEEKDHLMEFMIGMYPQFKKYYIKNKYYSTVRPQMVHIIKDGNNIIGTGKLLHRKIKIQNGSLTLFAFGVLIGKKYQKQGLGKLIVKRSVQKAKALGGDFLYGTTTNPVAKKMLLDLGFQKITAPIYYKDAGTKKIVREKNDVFVFAYKKKVFDGLNDLKKIYIGTGPI